MDYFVREVINGDPTAGPKARNDISTILEIIGWNPITLDFVFNEKLDELSARGALSKVKDNVLLRKEWGEKLRAIGNGDRLIIQFPVLRRPVALALTINAIRKRGGKVFCIVHDLEILRYNRRSDVGLFKKIRIALEERTVLNVLDLIVVHNMKMANKMEEIGFSSNKLLQLGIFDYLVSNYTEKERKLDKKVAIAGTLRPHKCRYLMNLPADVKFNLYGVGYEEQGKDNVEYFGAFPPDELPDKLDASFGLVWDGDSASSCTGAMGEYLRFNNPHKTSLYLAAGLPVIIWKDAALADFILKNGCGFTIDSLDEIGELISKLSEEDYKKMQENTKKASIMLRAGQYTKAAIGKIQSHYS